MAGIQTKMIVIQVYEDELNEDQEYWNKLEEYCQVYEVEKNKIKSKLFVTSANLIKIFEKKNEAIVSWKGEKLDWE